MRVVTRLIAGLCASFTSWGAGLSPAVCRGLYACSPGSIAPGPLLLLTPSTPPAYA
nr:MAG TPA: Insect kinin peptide [Caudoviricetes sp.]